MHSTYNFDLLAGALADLVGMLNSPRLDEFLLGKAGVTLDRALFPLLVRIAARPLSVSDLAEQVGRDHSTVSRQIAKLAALGLVDRPHAKTDQRVRAAAITASGRSMVEAISNARQQIFSELLADWSADDRRALAELNRRLANDMLAMRKANEL